MSYNHDHESEVNYFAKTNFRNAMTKFGIKTDDRRRHVYVIGKTGMGKTVLLENFTLSDIYSGHGCCYVDPHGDTAEKLINYIPSWRINDVVYFNPADAEYPVGFNILEAVSERHKHLVASGMMGVFKKIWEDQWSSRMEYILNNTILALLDNPGSTLLGINRMLSDPEYRKRIIGNVTDPVVRQFWLKEFASYNEKYAQEAVAPIQNKIGQFLSASVIRNIVAQVKSTINIREIMDSGKIFIVNLSKGRIGEDSSRLLGGLIITKLQLSAMERVDMAEKERLDFYLYVDEFQNFAVESFAGILSEARKYRLCLTIAHQYIAQLTDEVREAVFGNVGTIISFRVGSPDAKYMETEFAPRFLPEDIINLPKYNVYLKLLIDGVTSQPFSAITLPPISQKTDSEERVIKVSRERYAKERKTIEEQIMTWSGMGNMDVDTMLEAAEVKKKEDKVAAKDSKKPKFEYDCSRCAKKMILPVELDRSRPIYCEDCIEIVREEKKNKTGGKPTIISSSKPPEAPKPASTTSESSVVEVKPMSTHITVDSDPHLPDEPSISLASLMPKETEVVEKKVEEVELPKIEEVKVTEPVVEKIVEVAPVAIVRPVQVAPVIVQTPRPAPIQAPAAVPVAVSPKPQPMSLSSFTPTATHASHDTVRTDQSNRTAPLGDGEAPMKRKRKRKRKSSSANAGTITITSGDGSKPLAFRSAVTPTSAASVQPRQAVPLPAPSIRVESHVVTTPVPPRPIVTTPTESKPVASVPSAPQPEVVRVSVPTPQPKPEPVVPQTPKPTTGTLHIGQSIKFE